MGGTSSEADGLMIATPAPLSAIEMHCLHGFIPAKMHFDNKLSCKHRRLCIECVGRICRSVQHAVLGFYIAKGEYAN